MSMKRFLDHCSRGLVKNKNYEDKCYLCGRESNAQWIGTANVMWVCRECAMESLPALISDALADYDGHLALRNTEKNTKAVTERFLTCYNRNLDTLEEI